MLERLEMRAHGQGRSHNKVVSAAIGDLLHYGQAGLTLALAQSVQTCIEDERHLHRKTWLSLKSGG